MGPTVERNRRAVRPRPVVGAVADPELPRVARGGIDGEPPCGACHVVAVRDHGPVAALSSRDHHPGLDGERRSVEGGRIGHAGVLARPVEGDRCVGVPRQRSRLAERRCGDVAPRVPVTGGVRHRSPAGLPQPPVALRAVGEHAVAVRLRVRDAGSELRKAAADDAPVGIRPRRGGTAVGVSPRVAPPGGRAADRGVVGVRDVDVRRAREVRVERHAEQPAVDEAVHVRPQIGIDRGGRVGEAVEDLDQPAFLGDEDPAVGCEPDRSRGRQAGEDDALLESRRERGGVREEVARVAEHDARHQTESKRQAKHSARHPTRVTPRPKPPPRHVLDSPSPPRTPTFHSPPELRRRQ
jgi:hypothetical protein